MARQKSRNRRLGGVYQKTHFHYKSKSAVLNPKAYTISETAMMMNDRTGLMGLLNDYEQEFGKIQTAEERVTQIEKEFENLKRLVAAEGKEPLREMPENMLERYQTQLAWLDVTLEESDKIRKLLSEIEVSEQKIAGNGCLKYGPCGSGKIKNGVLAEIDGQFVELNEDKILVINHPSSPYHGMIVQDYRKLVAEPWLRTRRGSRNKAIKRTSLPPRPEDKKVKAS